MWSFASTVERIFIIFFKKSCSPTTIFRTKKSDPFKLVIAILLNCIMYFDNFSANCPCEIPIKRIVKRKLQEVQFTRIVQSFGHISSILVTFFLLVYSFGHKLILTVSVNMAGKVYLYAVRKVPASRHNRDQIQGPSLNLSLPQCCDVREGSRGPPTSC